MYASAPTKARREFVLHIGSKTRLKTDLGNQGPIFSTFFSAENSAEFLGKTIFQNFFSAENSIFSQHFWGKIFRGIFPEIFPGKNVRKIDPTNIQFLPLQLVIGAEIPYCGGSVNFIQDFET
jgi:hypothetical protein